MGEDVSIALFDDAIDGGEAEAGAFAFFLGGEEGFEDAGLSFLVHAVAGIGHGDDGVASGLDEATFAEALARRNVGGLDGQLAAFGHGVFGVDDQVHDDLLELTGIGTGVAGVGSKLGNEFDVLADQRPEKAFHIGDDAVDVDHLKFEELFAAEGQ